MLKPHCARQLVGGAERTRLWCNNQVARETRGGVVVRGAVVRSAAPVAGDAVLRAVEAPALTITGVSKTWPGQDVPVLAHVDLRAERGTTTAVVGRNGAGKTTLLRIAAGLIGPDAGRVEVAGIQADLDRTAYQRRIGFLSAGNSGLSARLKVEHHLDLWTRLALMPRRERRGAMEEAVETFALAPLCGRRVDRLSMGQRQRLRVALAFTHRPDVVLLDEPTNSLDDEGIAVVAAALDSLHGRGGAAVICLPSGTQQALPVDRTLVLTDGILEETA
jgi:ABC-type multidrug transport system ATPase subunit